LITENAIETVLSKLPGKVLNMSPHSDTLFWFWGNQSFSLMLRA
jgi:hypothetical protein